MIISKADDALRTKDSEPLGAMICNPTGMPSCENPQGTLAAVWPVMLIGKVNGKYPQNGFTAFPPIMVGLSSIGKAVTAMVGVSKRS